MAKKKKAFKQKFPKTIPITEEEYLQSLIKASERAITGQGSSIDEFFQQQAERLKKKLEELRKGNGKSKVLP